MKYLKLFESYDDIQQKVIKSLSDVSDLYSDGNDWNNCPFEVELLLLHQRENIEEIYYWHNKSAIEYVSLSEFRKAYNELLEDAPKKIIEELKKNPALFSEYGDYILNLDVNVPGWLIGANKYNL